MSYLDEAEVLVVGAGPAGCTAAEHAALGGADVLIIEKRREIGVPVRCGEFMPSVKEIRNIFPSAEIDDLFNVPDNLVSLCTSGIRIHTPGMRSYLIDFEGYTTDRDRFDQHLASMARGAGARIRTGCRYEGYRDGEAITDDGCIRAEVIIGADGPRSRVACSIGLPRPRGLCPAVTSQTDGDFEPVTEMYFGSVAPGGYAWIIPKRGGANVGVGVTPKFSQCKISDYLRAFAKERGLELGEIVGKEVPMAGPVGRTVRGSALTVGDAAGHVMAVNGGGIPIAMICGKLAGEVTADYVKRGRPLADYENGWRRMVGRPLRTATRSAWLASLFWGGSTRLELAMRLLGRRRMGKLIRCESPFP